MWMKTERRNEKYKEEKGILSFIWYEFLVLLICVLMIWLWVCQLFPITFLRNFVQSNFSFWVIMCLSNTAYWEVFLVTQFEYIFWRDKFTLYLLRYFSHHAFHYAFCFCLFLFFLSLYDLRLFCSIVICTSGNLEGLQFCSSGTFTLLTLNNTCPPLCFKYNAFKYSSLKWSIKKMLAFPLPLSLMIWF